MKTDLIPVGSGISYQAPSLPPAKSGPGTHCG